jgi:general secretion pathway protein D
MLLVVDSGLNIEKILSIIEAIDQPSLREGPDIVFLKNSSATDVARILNEGMGRDRTKVVARSPVAAKESKAVPDQRLNAVILFGNKAAKESMKSLIAALDVPSPEAQGRINVYFLEHADATELAKVLEGIVKSSQNQAKTRAGKGPAQAALFQEGSEVSITADNATNALIIVASPSDYQNLVFVIKQLDRRRKQVYVEAMIVEASIDKLVELGTKWRVIARHNGEPVAIGGFGTVDTTTLQSLVFGMSGFSAGGAGNFFNTTVNVLDPVTGESTERTLDIPGFAALFSLNEFEGAINVLSTPQILTSDNEEAEIHVGENVPFVSTRERDVTTTNTVLSSVERTDVGIILRITPQITEGDYIKLNIFQEISAVKDETDTDILINVGPTTTVRSTSTSVVVKDNQTVVIGGLIQERDEDNVNKLPLLGDLPLLGWLFKTKSTSKKKNNLLIFITPHVVNDAGDLEQITTHKQKQFAVDENQYVEGEILVKFKNDISDDKAMKIISEHGASLIKLMQSIGVYHIRLREGLAVEDAIKEFSSLSEVEYAEPNFRMSINQ